MKNKDTTKITDHLSTKSLIKRALWWAATTLFVMISIGLNHMHARLTTLAYVQAYDFMLLKRAFYNLDARKADDLETIKSTINTLSAPNRSIFPIALISDSSCVENNELKNICKIFPNTTEFSRERSESHTHKIDKYNLKINIIKPSNEKYFAYSVLENGDLLIAETNHYLTSFDSAIPSELTFLKNDSFKYLSNKQLFNLMYRKSFWSWIIISTISLALFTLKETLDRRRIQEFSSLKKQEESIEGVLIESHSLLQNTNTAKDALEIEILKLKNEIIELEGVTHIKSELEKNLAEKERELKAKELKIKSIEDQYYTDLEHRYRLEAELKDLRSKLPSTFNLDISNQESKSLNQLKSLWINNKLSWDQRRNIEGMVSLSTLKRTPFTDYLVYTSIEQWVEKSCILHRLIWPNDKNDLHDQINLLKNNSIISPEESNLLHEARIARNDWFHSGHTPNQALTLRVIKFLKSKNKPNIVPRL